MTKVSFLIAAYNEEEYIRECIESCLSQEEVDVEVCVVDDGSKDQTSRILGDLAAIDSRVRFMCFEKNRGKVAAFNAAYEMASGEFIALVGADDVNAMNRAALSVREIKATGANLVYADYYVCDDKLAVLGRKFCSPKVSEKQIAFNNKISGGTVLFDHAFARAVFPIPVSLRFEDWWIAFVAVLSFKLVKLNEPVLYYRHHGQNDSVSQGGVTASKRKDYARHGDYYREFLAYMDRNGVNKPELVVVIKESALLKRLYVAKGLAGRLSEVRRFVSEQGVPRSHVGWFAVLGILPFGPAVFNFVFSILGRVRRGG